MGVIQERRDSLFLDEICFFKDLFPTRHTYLVFTYLDNFPSALLAVSVYHPNFINATTYYLKNHVQVCISPDSLTHLYALLNIDIDECSQQSHDCEINELCINIRGSYDCQSCPRGFKTNGNVNRCTQGIVIQKLFL